MQKKNDLQQLDAEIQKLKELLQQKIIEYKNISHPEVILISKRLDEKLNAYMRHLNNLDIKAPKNNTLRQIIICKGDKIPHSLISIRGVIL